MKDRIRKICDAINQGFRADEAKKVKALQSLEAAINSMSDYIGTVVAMDTALQVAKFHMEPDEYRDHIMRLDRNRRTAHDAMLGRVSSINRICRMVNCDPLYDGNVDDRYAVANFAGKVVRNIFENRTQKNSRMTLSEILDEASKE